MPKELVARFKISIHSLRVEGDVESKYLEPLDVDISIHALRVEGDCINTGRHYTGFEFQSTPSVWRATRRM